MQFPMQERQAASRKLVNMRAAVAASGAFIGAYQLALGRWPAAGKPHLTSDIITNTIRFPTNAVSDLQTLETPTNVTN